jgi:hypothetical protein
LGHDLGKAAEIAAEGVYGRAIGRAAVDSLAEHDQDPGPWHGSLEGCGSNPPFRFLRLIDQQAACGEFNQELPVTDCRIRSVVIVGGGADG